MPLPFGMTTRGKIWRHLREHPAEPFTVKEVAAQFKTSVRNVQGLLVYLEELGWTVTRTRRTDKSVVILAWPPAKKANA